MNNKILTSGIVFLFLGLAFAQTINANGSNDNKMVEITTEICGFNGGKHTIQLKQEEVDELEQMIDEIKRRLDEVKTRDDAVEIFKEAVVELEGYGLLGGLSIKQAQKLMTGGFLGSRVVNHLENLYSKIKVDNESNYFCLIVGKTDNTMFEGPVTRLITRILYFVVCVDLPMLALLTLLIRQIPLLFSAIINPLAVGYIIGYGYDYLERDKWHIVEPANGWVYTVGLNNIKSWISPLFGQLPMTPFYFIGMHPGVIGFTGIKIFFKAPLKHIYIGSALSVKLGPNLPDS